MRDMRAIIYANTMMGTRYSETRIQWEGCSILEKYTNLVFMHPAEDFMTSL